MNEPHKDSIIIANKDFIRFQEEELRKARGQMEQEKLKSKKKFKVGLSIGSGVGFLLGFSFAKVLN